MKETAVEAKFVRGCRLFDFIQMKAEVLGRGWPDRIIFGAGAQVAFVELKRPGDPEARRRQRAIHAPLIELGFRVEILSTPDFVEMFFRSFTSQCKLAAVRQAAER
jgi:hypothetical protein